MDKCFLLFKSGTESFAKNSKGKRTLKFRAYTGKINDEMPEPKDRGYYYKMPNSTSKIVHYVFKDNGFLETNSKNWTMLWNVGTPKTELFNNMQFWQKVNHFPKANEITRKDCLNINIEKMQLKHGKSYNFIPKTYILPQEMSLIISDHEKSK